MQELVVLLGGNNRPIGSAEKLSIHHANTPLHLAFSCYVFDGEGRLLITQRAKSKKVWPGYWTNSVCGHPAPNESFEQAVRRRAQFELGMQISNVASALPDYSYRTPPSNGIIENEFCPVFFARAASDAEVNPDEVEAYEWVSWSEFIARIKKTPDDYSYWCKDQLPRLQKLPLLQEYINK